MPDILSIFYFMVYNLRMDLLPVLKYQGDKARALFLMIGFIMLIGALLEPVILFYSIELPAYAFVVLCVVVAGAVNRKLPWSFVISGIFALAFMVVFQISATGHFMRGENILTVLDEVIAILLFFTTYYSFRSYRELKQFPDGR